MRPPERELDGVARGCPHVRGRTASDASMLAKALADVGGVNRRVRDGGLIEEMARARV